MPSSGKHRNRTDCTWWCFFKPFLNIFGFRKWIFGFHTSLKATCNIDKKVVRGGVLSLCWERVHYERWYNKFFIVPEHHPNWLHINCLRSLWLSTKMTVIRLGQDTVWLPADPSQGQRMSRDAPPALLWHCENENFISSPLSQLPEIRCRGGSSSHSPLIRKFKYLLPESQCGWEENI